jgi:endonuclease/exonuclease/phosphatase (EEP) superfamily protein YafD
LARRVILDPVSDETPRAWHRRRAAVLIGGAAAVVGTGAALSFLSGVLAGGRWPYVVATYLRLPQVAVLAVTALVLGVLRWRRFAAVLGALAVGAAATVVAPALDARVADARPMADAAPAGLRIAVFNTGHRNDDIDAIASALRAARPDVAVMPESADIADRLDEAMPELVRLGAQAPDELQPPVVLARREWPVEVAPLDGTRPAAIVTVTSGPTAFDVVAMHPLPPVTRAWAEHHERSYAALTRRALPRPRPWIVAGDLNTTPWSPSMDRLRGAGLRGATVRATFGAPWVGIPLDHVLVSAGLTVVSRELGPFAGSDHRLLVAEVTGRGDRPSASDR